MNSVFISGGSSEVGCALIRRLLAAEPDVRVLAHCHTGTAKLDAVREETGAGERVVALPADFREPAAATELGRRIRDEFGVPRRIAHLPAVPLRYQRIAKMDWGRVEQDLTVQVRSIASLLSVFIPDWAKTREEAPRPKVVFMLSSVTLGAPPKFMAEYTVAKYALLALMRSLAAEQPGVSVNGVSPSMIETAFLRDLPHSAVEMAAQAHPMGRNAVTGDVAGALQFLLSPDADYISGVNLPVTGGAA